MIVLTPIGRVRSPLVEPSVAPKRACVGVPEARLEVEPEFREGLVDVEPKLDRARER